jgi:hypothetical protein
VTVPNDLPAPQLTTGAPPGRPAAVTVDQARAAWATASRDTELDRWQELYDLTVPKLRQESSR